MDLYYYALGKLALDPSYDAVARLACESSHPLLDIGCGIGLLAAYLRERGHAQPILGTDVDEVKIAAARKWVTPHYADLTFNSGDAGTGLPEFSGTVVMLDVLHYFDSEKQQRLLSEIAGRVAPGAHAIIRTATNDAGWRHFATIAEEALVRSTGWISRRFHEFPEREAIMKPFEERGFEAACQPMWGLTPFNGYMFQFRRPEG